jgi:LiaI-LiaF-like transmembrane region
MSDRIRCRCESCTIDSFLGPAVITTLGVLFLIGQLSSGDFSFTRTWPVLLLVIGLIKLASAIAPRTGHLADSAPVPPTAAAPPAQQPPPSQTPSPGQGQ